MSDKSAAATLIVIAFLSMFLTFCYIISDFAATQQSPSVEERS